ncbi:RAB36 protein, partial [Amia calva]|nr:RAB36 protein [Amia calva]
MNKANSLMKRCLPKPRPAGDVAGGRWLPWRGPRSRPVAPPARLHGPHDRSRLGALELERNAAVRRLSQCNAEPVVQLLKLSKVVVVGDLYVGKTCLINRFCKGVFDRDYKATIGVDFEIERFEISGMPYTLQIWDTAGQEKFKCIASAYYRGAQVIITVFDLADIKTLEHTRQWLEDALRENESGSCFVFLVGTKRDLLSEAECERTERDAVRLAAEIQAEFWSVSAKTGENVRELFFRVAGLAFEDSLLRELNSHGTSASAIGQGDLISKNTWG